MPTIKDVAALAGVSYTTVSHVLNGTRTVAPETAERVRDAVRQLGFSPNAVARGLRKGASKTLGVVSISSADPYFMEVVHGIQQKSWDHGYAVYLAYSELIHNSPMDAACGEEDEFDRRERDLIANLSARDIQGLIINSLQTDEALVKSTRRVKIPCILYQRCVPDAGFDCFISDDYGGTAAAMEHLASLGHERIAVVGALSYPSHTVGERKRAWEDALADRKLAAPAAWFRDGQFDMQRAYDKTRDLLALEPRPTAILYYSDLMAMGGLKAARDAGLSVPGDLSVIGYDDLSTSAFTIPALTSVHQKTFEMGMAMEERLLERIENPGLEPRVVRYGQSLTVRASTGPAPAKA